MAIKDGFIAELKHESTITKKILEKVPLDNKEWQPHAKSMTVGRLATHIAELPHWAVEIQQRDVFDFTKDLNFKFVTAASSGELMQIFESNLEAAIEAL